MKVTMAWLAALALVLPMCMGRLKTSIFKYVKMFAIGYRM